MSITIEQAYNQTKTLVAGAMMMKMPVTTYTNKAIRLGLHQVKSNGKDFTFLSKKAEMIEAIKTSKNLKMAAKSIGVPYTTFWERGVKMNLINPGPKTK